ncbi:MAG: bifunctional heptose 7-phosphate kinase/heptose 1-phosphate adenyltransferase, partial [Bacillota bacterium]
FVGIEDSFGESGEGYELLKGLENTGVVTDYMFETDKRSTPTYIKPMIIREEKEEEINRLDIRNWSTTLPSIEEKINHYLKILAEEVDAIIVLDQVDKENHGVITSRIRKTLAQLGKEKDDLIIYADSRYRIHKFNNIIIKCNHYEAVKSLYPGFSGEPEESKIREAGISLNQNNGKPVFVTWGEKGQFVVNQGEVTKVPAVKVEGPVDICGAGDAATSGIVTALCGGASLEEAALVGNLTASVTIKKLGTTGTASPEEVVDSLKKV